MQIYIVEAEEEEKARICDAFSHRDFEVRWYRTGQRFLDICSDLPSGIVIIDVCLPDFDGLALQHKLWKDCDADHQVILLSGPCDICDVVRAMREGAVDFLEKPFRRAELLDAITRAELIIQDQRQAVERQRMEDERFMVLSKRERDILQASADGKSTKQVAHVLALSARTVEMHRSNIIRKLGVTNFAGALVLAASTASLPDS